MIVQSSVMTLKHVHLLILHISHFVVFKVSILFPSITVRFCVIQEV